MIGLYNPTMKIAKEGKTIVTHVITIILKSISPPISLKIIAKIVLDATEIERQYIKRGIILALLSASASLRYY